MKNGLILSLICIPIYLASCSVAHKAIRIEKKRVKDPEFYANNLMQKNYITLKLDPNQKKIIHDTLEFEAFKIKRMIELRRSIKWSKPQLLDSINAYRKGIRIGISENVLNDKQNIERFERLDKQMLSDYNTQQKKNK